MAKIPKTASQAKTKGYQKKSFKHSIGEKKKWVMLKKKGGPWQFTKVATATASGSHTVCYYDPNTGEWDDCHSA